MPHLAAGRCRWGTRLGPHLLLQQGAASHEVLSSCATAVLDTCPPMALDSSFQVTRLRSRSPFQVCSPEPPDRTDQAGAPRWATTPGSRNAASRASALPGPGLIAQSRRSRSRDLIMISLGWTWHWYSPAPSNSTSAVGGPCYSLTPPPATSASRV